ncbi:aminopeptidase [Marinobacter zhejiangensis]|uniref:Predicted aminopeptidase n=1 Tax=Marinobacter zhejiangensis TaxID=488535 RepID=A0A1I4L3U2_9GAMM|nr:aminopeptidase [Marinobacter zhejiangensis]SFL85591.1 Predicted aminopeptidase [Marinobacter zhejiangensis]
MPFRHPMTQLSHASLILLMIAALAGCTSVQYYSQAISGQAALMWSAQPVAAVLNDPEPPPELKAKLATATTALAFASDRLALPVGDAYSDYVAFERPFVVVNLMAVPEFSLTPHQWCYPIVGCQSYRGYFDPDDARDEQAEFDQRQFDTFIGGVTAYSTLGWFDDPLHSGFTRLPDDRMVALIFHELSHRVVYMNGDTAFNESFATAVELEGLRLWLEQMSQPERFQQALTRLQQRNQTLALVADASVRLEAIYQRQQEISPEQLRAEKARQMSQLREDYLALSADWELPGPFGRQPPAFNNAHLALFRQYNQHVPAFRQLLRELNYHFDDFYRAVEALSELTEEQRSKQLATLAQRFDEHL